MFCHGASPSLPPLLTLVPTLLTRFVSPLLPCRVLSFLTNFYQNGLPAWLVGSSLCWHGLDGAVSSHLAWGSLILSSQRGHRCSLPLLTPGDICTQNTKAFILSAALSSNSQQHGRRGADNHRCTYRSKSYPSSSHLTISLPAHFSLISVFPTSVATQEGYRESYRAYPIQLTQ